VIRVLVFAGEAAGLGFISSLAEHKIKLLTGAGQQVKMNLQHTAGIHAGGDAGFQAQAAHGRWRGGGTPAP